MFSLWIFMKFFEFFFPPPDHSGRAMRRRQQKAEGRREIFAQSIEWRGICCIIRRSFEVLGKVRCVFIKSCFSSNILFVLHSLLQILMYFFLCYLWCVYFVPIVRYVYSLVINDQTIAVATQRRWYWKLRPARQHPPSQPTDAPLSSSTPPWP